MTSSYWSPTHKEPREDELLEEMLKSAIGDDFYPGDMTPSEHWPGAAPGTRGIINALSPKYCDWSALADLDPKPPILWTYGTEDVVISDSSAWDVGMLGQAGHVPGWPGEDAHPPQPMVVPDRGRCSSATATSASSRSRARATSRRSTRPSAGARVFFGFLDGRRVAARDRRLPAAQALAQPHGQPVDRAAADLPAGDARGAARDRAHRRARTAPPCAPSAPGTRGRTSRSPPATCCGPTG